MRRLAAAVFVLLFWGSLSSDTLAFDGNRQGFMVSWGGGGGLTSTKVDILGSSTRSSKVGLASSHLWYRHLLSDECGHRFVVWDATEGDLAVSCG